eukprot:17810-Alexandrium_andersonii.AAC.1
MGLTQGRPFPLREPSRGENGAGNQQQGRKQTKRGRSHNTPTAGLATDWKDNRQAVGMPTHGGMGTPKT